MLTYSPISDVARRADVGVRASLDFNDPLPHSGAMLLRTERRFEHGQRNYGRASLLSDLDAAHANDHALEIRPAHVVSRRAAAWDGIGVEVIQSITHDKVEFRFRAPRHLLLVYEECVRDDGETVVGELPRSMLRSLGRKLTFVPAGHEFREWQHPRVRGRVICFYFDPAKMPARPNAGVAVMSPAPRLFFESKAIWETAVKLAGAIEDGCVADRYSEALAVVVAHELLLVHGHVRPRGPRARGGLAVWQQRTVAAYIEEHLAESIPLAHLARLANLSSYHFCRAFKQSFGIPPHRYHIARRIELAKTLLANTARSVSEIALALGFSETSSFSAAFRHLTGAAPTEYRRALG